MVLKTEKDIDDVPFESVEVYCGQKDDKKELLMQIDTLKNEKAELINSLVTEKKENQTLYFEVKSQQQNNSLQETELMKLKKMLAEQNTCVANLTRENNALKSKIKQLMANSCVSGLDENLSTNDSEDEFEVEAILGHRGKKGKYQYLIRWKNYPPSEDSWEKEANLNCPEILLEYKKINFP